ncbi:MAG: indolepyruvate oxidoreductase subunit beta [Methanosarcinaceae archaeon]|nr:indolepyruvate oxidoreductase subunit beta [Methanosarcinaceae archaeon]
MSMEESDSFDLLISGIGGQGAILASDIIGRASVLEGFSIRAAETHGMAQRGGSVVNHIRIGCDLGTMIPLKGTDGMMAMEPIEAMRYIDQLSDNGVLVMNTEPVYPVTVTSGNSEYPEVTKIVESLKKDHRVIAFNASEIATKAGAVQAMNVVMVGAISNFLPLDKSVLLACIKEMVPPRTIDVNIKAFEMGRSAVDL